MTIAGPFLVHLVDEYCTGLVPVVQSSPEFDGFNLGTLSSVYNNECRFTAPECRDGLTNKVGSTRSVDNICLILIPLE